MDSFTENPVTGEVFVSKLITVIFSFFLLASTTFAQVPGGNVYVGYSYLRADLPGGNANLNGWNGSVEVKVLPFIGMVGDFSGNYGSQNIPSSFFFSPVNASIRQHNFLFGPRFSFTIGKIRPFVHALVGAAHLSESATDFSNSDTSFADGLGGGVDYHLIPLIAWRVQVDDLQTRFFNSRQDDLRISTGIVVHF